MKKKYLSITLILLSLGFTACTTKTEQITTYPTTLDVAVIATHTKTPIAIHFFQLETDEYFKRLDYFELMKKKRSKLQGEIVKQSKKILSPSQMEKRHIKVDSRVRYYAVVAGFADVKSNDNWRYIQEIIPESKNDITLILNQNSMKRVKK